MTVVVDTNVILVANGQHPDVGPSCLAACAVHLQKITREGCVVIDDGHRILNEYKNKTAPRVGKRVGDQFVKWLLRNLGNGERCNQVRLLEDDRRGFDGFPDDARLSKFDSDDRVFVAVAALHGGTPPILQAADSKWIDWEPALKDHGIEVVFLCPDDIRRFDGNKKKRKGKS